MNEETPKTIYDMYGFPKELYEVKYNTAGSPGMAKISKDLISRKTEYDNSWGIDHGTWSVLVHMYPDREIPVFQISIDADAPPAAHYKIGKELRALREQGVLLFGTGNIVHNLRLVDWNKENEGFDWAYIGRQKWNIKYYQQCSLEVQIKMFIFCGDICHYKPVISQPIICFLRMNDSTAERLHFRRTIYTLAELFF